MTRSSQSVWQCPDRSVDRAAALLICVLLLGIAGCLPPLAGRWLEVDAGLYTPVTPGAGAPEPPWSVISGIESVFVDPPHRAAWILQDDASLTLLPYEPQPRNGWLTGCPTNLYATHMEVLDLATETLVVGTETIHSPILVRNCPVTPVQLALRDAGAIANGDMAVGGAACVGARQCLLLDRAARTFALPPSLKGYELYSWQGGEEDTSTYALLTATNRDKTWQEISAPGSTLTTEGWVAIQVRGEPLLESVLDRLPEGEAIFWRSALAEPDPASHVRLPDARTRREIAAYCRKRGLQLSID